MLNTSEGADRRRAAAHRAGLRDRHRGLARWPHQRPHDIARGPFVDGTNWAIDTDYPTFDLEKAKSLVAEVQAESGPTTIVPPVHRRQPDPADSARPSPPTGTRPASR